MRHFQNFRSGNESATIPYSLKVYISELEPEGYLGFVVPKPLTYSGFGEGIRKFILRETEILKIFDVHEAFEGVLLEQIAIILRKKQDKKKEFVEVQYIDLPYTKNKIGKHKSETKLFNNEIFPIYKYPQNAKLYDLINKDSQKLKEIAEPIFRGMPIQKHSYLFTEEKINKEDSPIIRGSKYRTVFVKR